MLPAVLVLWSGLIYLNSCLREPPFRIIPREFFFLLTTQELAFPIDARIMLDCLRSIIVGILYTGIGALFLKRAGIGCRGTAFLPTAFGMGIALLAVPLEFLGMFFLLSRWSTVVVLLSGFVAASLPWKRILGTPQEPPAQENRKHIGFERIFAGLTIALITLISALTFYHAVLFPVVYWDSLIYYVGYARKTFEAAGFPVHVTAQVGLGIGANYPHLFHSLQNVPAFLFGEWSTGYGQFLPPLFGVFACLLVYALILDIWKNRLLAAMGALLFRAIPYGICYFIYASDYSMAIFYVALFLYLAHRFYKDPCPTRLFLLGLSASAAAKVNYLMPFLSVFFFLIALSRLVRNDTRWRIRGVVVSAVCLVLASTWYVRNWVVAGNPIYPYFPGIFGGKNIDPEVLRSCETEWLKHGDGIGRFGPGLGTKIASTPRFFLTEKNFHWKLWPIFVAFWFPGAVLFIVDRARKRNNGGNGEGRSVLWLSLAITGFILFYEYVISSLYSYHMTPFLPAVALTACVSLRRTLPSRFGYVAGAIVLFSGVIPGLSMAVMGPKIMDFGLRHIRRGDDPYLFDTMTIWNPKPDGRIECIRHPSSNSRIVETFLRNRLPKDFLKNANGNFVGTLVRSPLVSRKADAFLMQKFKSDYLMFAWLGDLLPENAKVLSHENRHLYLPEDVTIVHLDDWELSQRFYGAEWKDLKSYLIENNVNYYLKVPFENDHPILKRLGLDAVLDTEWTEIARWETFAGEKMTFSTTTLQTILYELKRE